MNVPIGIAVIIGFIVVAELGRWVFARPFGYQAERHAIPIMKLPGTRGTQGFRLALILAGPVTVYLVVAALAFGFHRCHGHADPDRATEVARVVEGFDAVDKVQAGDVLVEVDGTPFSGGSARLSEHVASKQGAPVTLVVARAGTRQTITVKPTERDGRWLIGVSLEAKREHGTGRALKDAIIYPAQQTAHTFESLIEIFKGREQAEPGGPVRIVAEVRSSFEASGGTLVLQLGMIFGTYALIALALFDLFRAVFLLMFRS